MKTPLAQWLDLGTYEFEILIDATLFRQLIGSLLQLASTVHTDIAFAAGYLFRFLHKLAQMLWKADKPVLRYFGGR